MPTSSPSDDRPNRIPWPPILDLMTALAAYGLEHALPLPVPRPPVALRGLGAGLAAVGFAIALAGVLRLRALGTPVSPTGRAEVLARDGIYRFTRNPMYTGTLVFFFGLGLALGSAWLMLLPAPLGFALYWLAIRREEAFLERRFGAAYLSYKASTRRWL
jgi:protein-S-isoprenylcysteine O-methyltransferase Ste14